MIDHISDLVIDRMLAGEAIEGAREHAAGCARCGARLAELTAERDAFVVPNPAKPLPRPRVWKRYAGVAGALVAAAAAVILVVRKSDDAGTRTKGSNAPILDLLVERGALRAIDGPLHPDDRIQATYVADRAGFGAVVSSDGSIYVPVSALPASSTPAPYPASTILDAVLGRERVTVIWCPASFDVASVPATCTTRVVEIEKR